MTERERLLQEIRNIEADLKSSNSEIGDYKIIKCYEYQLKGLEAPYDINKLHADRQAARNRINEIQSILANLPE